MFCSECGSEIKTNDKFCPRCGKKLIISHDNLTNSIEILVAAAKCGDEHSFQKLYEMTSSRSYYVALKMVKSDSEAQDVMQDAYIRIYQHLEQYTYTGESSFASWISKIVSNTALNHLRKQKEVLFSDIEGNDEGDLSFDIEDEDFSRQPELAYDKKEATHIVDELLDELSAEQRVCTLMFYYHEQSVKDIATEIGCSENTVKSRLHQSRKKMMDKAEDLKKRGLLTGILSMVGLVALLRSTEACAMEQVPSEIYSQVMHGILCAVHDGSVVANVTHENNAVYTGTTVSSGATMVDTVGVVTKSAFALKVAAITLGVVAAVSVGGVVYTVVDQNSEKLKMSDQSIDSPASMSAASDVEDTSLPAEESEEGIPSENPLDIEHITDTYEDYVSNLPKMITTYTINGYDSWEGWEKYVDFASESEVDSRIRTDKSMSEEGFNLYTPEPMKVYTKYLNKYCITNIDGDDIPELILVCEETYDDGYTSENTFMICKYNEDEVLPLLYVGGLRGGFYMAEDSSICAVFGGSDFQLHLFLKVYDYDVKPSLVTQDISDKYEEMDTRPEYGNADSHFEFTKFSDEEYEKLMNDMGYNETQLKKIGN